MCVCVCVTTPAPFVADMMDTHAQEVLARLLIWDAEEAEYQRHLESENQSLVNIIEERCYRERVQELQHELCSVQCEWHEHRHRLGRRDICLAEEAAFESLRDVHRKRTRSMITDADECRKRLCYVDAEMIKCQKIALVEVMEPAARFQLAFDEQWSRVRIGAMMM